MTRAGSSGAVPTLNGKGLRIGIVSARFNDHIVTALRDGALRGLERCGVADKDIVEHWVPGAFEVPLAAKVLAETGTVDAIICLGTVIRGDTPHFEYVCEAATRGIQDAQMSTGVPVMFGVLTLNTEQQAIDRSGPGIDNKGDEAALGAVEMALLLKTIRNELVSGCDVDEQLLFLRRLIALLHPQTDRCLFPHDEKAQFENGP